MATSYRTNAGAQAQAQMMGSAESPPVAYIGVSGATLTPATGDTTLSGELSGNGFSRALATYGGYTAPATLNGPASFTLAYTFTNTGGSTQTIASAACFTAATGGTMFSEGNLDVAKSVAPGETITITFTVQV